MLGPVRMTAEMATALGEQLKSSSIPESEPLAMGLERDVARASSAPADAVDPTGQASQQEGVAAGSRGPPLFFWLVATTSGSGETHGPGILPAGGKNGASNASTKSLCWIAYPLSRAGEAARHALHGTAPPDSADAEAGESADALVSAACARGPTMLGGDSELDPPPEAAKPGAAQLAQARAASTSTTTSEA